MQTLLPLFVGIPLLSVGLAAILPWKAARDALALLIPGIWVVGGFVLFIYTGAHGVVVHQIGGFIGGVAIPFAADQFSAIMLITASLVTLAANWFAVVIGETKARFYPALALMLFTGVNGTLLTADLFDYFVWIEVMLLPSYGLMAMTGTSNRIAGGRIFITVNLTASTMLMMGAVIVYGVQGAVNIAALRGMAGGNGPVTVAMGMVMIALIAKAGVFPVHTWLPRTYTSGSAAVMALFSALHTKMAVYLIFRLWVVVFDMDQRWNTVIIVFMVVSMLVGGFAGLAENSIRRVLAYQMVNGMPFILVPLAFVAGNAQLALAAGLFYALHHMVTVGSLALTSGAIEETYGTGLIRKLSGIARRDKVVAFLFAGGAFSMVGFPPFSGLWGKVGVMVQVAHGHTVWSWIVITAIVLASFGALLCFLRIWKNVFWGQTMDTDRIPADVRVRPSAWAPAAALLAISAAMFLGAGPVITATQDATAQLLDVDSYQEAILGDGAVGVPNHDDFQGGSR